MLRLQHGWTQEVLAKKVFVTPEAVCMWEKGKRTPSFGNQHHLANAFNVSRSLMFADLDEEAA